MWWIIAGVVAFVLLLWLNAKLQPKQTPLHLAARSGKVQDLIEALKTQPNVDVLGRDGLTPLHLGVLFGHQEVVAELLKGGANAQALTIVGYSCLHIAAMFGLPPLVKTLLASGVPVDLPDKDGNTAFTLVSCGPQVPARKLLASRWSDLNLPSPDFLGTAQVLIDCGADIAHRDSAGVLPIMHAVSSGQLDLVRLLRERGSELTAREPGTGASLLHLAAFKGFLPIATYLLDQGMAVNDKSREKDLTPLHVAAHEGKLGIVRLLCERGADTALKQADGMTALDLAEHNDHTRVVDFLKK